MCSISVSDVVPSPFNVTRIFHKSKQISFKDKRFEVPLSILFLSFFHFAYRLKDYKRQSARASKR